MTKLEELQSLYKTIDEVTKWSGKVKTKWSPPEGFFTQSAEKIASGLKSASDSLQQAMSRLNFFINRGGSNIKNKGELEKAKDLLSKAYA